MGLQYYLSACSIQSCPADMSCMRVSPKHRPLTKMEIQQDGPSHPRHDPSLVPIKVHSLNVVSKAK